MESQTSRHWANIRTQGNVQSDVKFIIVRVIAKRSVDSILNERKLLSNIKHRYLVNMVYAFQDRSSLYLVMNMMEGGDLRYHIAKKHCFSEM